MPNKDSNLITKDLAFLDSLRSNVINGLEVWLPGMDSNHD